MLSILHVILLTYFHKGLSLIINCDWTTVKCKEMVFINDVSYQYVFISYASVKIVILTQKINVW